MSIGFVSPETSDIAINVEPSNPETLEAVTEAAIEKPGLVLPNLVDKLYDKFPARIAEDEATHIQTMTFITQGHNDTVIARTAPDDDGNREVSIFAEGHGAPGITLSARTAEPESCKVRTEFFAHRREYGTPETAIPAVLRSLDRSVAKYEWRQDASAKVGAAAVQLLKSR